MSPLKIDFNTKEVQQWYVVNDGVMGGLSEGKVTKINEGFRFFGTVSLDNNGGFTSYRSPNRAYTLEGFEEVVVRYRSEGVGQALQLSVDNRFYIPNYKIDLPKSEEWATKVFTLAEVKQYRLGNPTGAYLNEAALSEVIRLSFITGEKKAGEFLLEVDYIAFR